jgi:beta-lactamase regulating signal transducer with metallopeptidase domain
MASLIHIQWTTLSLLIDASVKGIVLLAVATCLDIMLRKGPAQQRSTVWSIALIGTLLIPVASHLLPAWPIVTLPTLQSPAAENLTISESAAKERANDSLRVPGFRPQIDTGDARPVAVTSSKSEVRSLEQFPATQGLVVWILALWLAGALTALLRQGLGFFKIAGLARRAQVPDASFWEPLVARSSRQVGLRSNTRLLLSSEIATPITWGLRRPLILLPLRAEQWCLERCEMVLLHEMVHIRRGDWLIRMVGRTTCSIHWFNPLTWLAMRRLRALQELACDAEVLALGVRASSYAAHLLAIARSSPRPMYQDHALGMVRRLNLEKRIMSILNPKTYSWTVKVLIVPITLVMAGLVPAIAAMQPRSATEVAADGSTARHLYSQDLRGVLVEMRDIETSVQPTTAPETEVPTRPPIPRPVPQVIEEIALHSQPDTTAMPESASAPAAAISPAIPASTTAGSDPSVRSTPDLVPFAAPLQVRPAPPPPGVSIPVAEPELSSTTPLLEAIPMRHLSRHYYLAEDGVPVATLTVKRWRPRAELSVGEATYDLYREGRWRGEFVLASGGKILARATKPKVLRRGYELHHGESTYTLRHQSLTSRRFVLTHGERQLGVIEPQSWHSRRAHITLPPEWPLALRVFVFWLVDLSWRQDDEAVNASMLAVSSS